MSMEQIEMVASVKSWHLGDLEKQKASILDYSSGNEEADIYALYFRGNKGLTKLLFEPDEKMLEYMRQRAPRKVFI